MENADTYEELALFKRIASGDEKAFTTIFRTYYPRINTLLDRTIKDREQVKEVVQEFFLKLWTKRHLLSNVTDPRGYLFRMAANTATDHFRSMQRERLVVYAIHEELATPPNNDQLVSLSAKLLHEEIERLIDQLPPRQREIFRLFREEGMTRAEIADKLDISPSTVKNHFTQALNTLQEKLKDRTGILLPAILFLCRH